MILQKNSAIKLNTKYIHQVPQRFKYREFVFAWLLILAFLASLSLSYAENSDSESSKDKTIETGDNIKRGAKKFTNRTKKILCAKDNAKCLAKKVKHHLNEDQDYLGGKTHEYENTTK